ncbi:ATP-binding protein [Acerihabitans sp. TG2]|uniref:ATP-binding protein n=1 Tax=Acerihabitans sp. TG2 TaxID=3096008 RepID=UPI002B222CAC|nr:ATP-binding protein [Acerihabitans sp. TG2]MEA9390112.1 ATP-binding protein [Acerihabitans sp. TG2]
MPSDSALFSRRKKMSLDLSPWLLVGLSLILGLAIAVLATTNTSREKHYMTQSLLNRADSLIWSIEAGARTAMGFQEDNRLLQSLIEQTAHQPGVLYLMVINNQGQIIAHSEQAKIGTTIPEDQAFLNAPPAGETHWRRLKTTNGEVFEASRLFTPSSPHSTMMMMMHGATTSALDEKTHILVGLDPKPSEETFNTDRRNNLILASLVALLGLGGFISLFWAHSYRRSNRLLKDTQALAAEVVTCLPVGLLTCDSGGNIVMANTLALDMLGMKNNHFMGIALQSLGGLDWHAIIAILAKNEKILEKEMELDNSKGGTIPISLSASQIRNEQGLDLGYVFILRDLGEVKQLQADVRRNERLTALGHMAAGVAHEIRNPLSSIKGLATYLSGKFLSEGPESTAAKTMILEVDRLNRVVSELLEFARTGAMVLKETDLNVVILHALRLAETDAKIQNTRLLFSPDALLPKVPLNEERFTQALLNLLINAIQSMSTAGTISVSVAIDDNKRRLAIAIKDNGRGMSPEIIDSIFTPYFTTKSSGTGLGLAIVQQIVEGHNGEINVTSQPGVGSVFTIFLSLRHAGWDDNDE